MKAYTDINQSKKLAEILPLESADMCFNTHNNMPPLMTPYRRFKEFFDMEPTPAFLIPCWSLAALLDVLPKFIGDYGKCLYYDVDGSYCGYMDDGNFMLTIQETKADNPVDACVTMIEKLHEQNML